MATAFSLLPFVAAALSAALAGGSVLRKRPSPATWFFFVGMLAMSLDSLVTGISLRAERVDQLARWLTAGLVVKSIVPVVWMGFSLTYSRGNRRQFLADWKWALLFFALAPLALALGFRDDLLVIVSPGTPAEALHLQFGPAALALNVVLLLALVLILTNLEQTTRSAVGTMRWRIKFVMVALGVIFGARLYVRSQAILFSAPDIALWGLESGALVVGCLLLGLAYRRTGAPEIDVYPSRAVLQSSLTVLVVGGYLLVVGVLAQIVRRLGGVESLQLQSVVVLLGATGLAVLLLSDRLRQRLRVFVGRHFRKAQHDSVSTWAELSRRLASGRNQSAVCTESAKLLSETFEALSVSVWLIEERDDRMTAAAWTSHVAKSQASREVTAGLAPMSAPFDLEQIETPWANELRALCPSTFPNGGSRLCVPLRVGDHAVGAVVLADRVNGLAYSEEERDLLQCIAGQMTSALLNLRLVNEVSHARELEAFRTMSAFFVHDLKNAASSLNLMLKNLPVHFDDPAFRQDALRAIGNTARRIDDILARLGALRQKREFSPVVADLNQIVKTAIEALPPIPGVEFVAECQQLPRIMADREQLQSVVTNVLVNARDAVSPGGRISVRTARTGGRVTVSVSDTGCGMSPEFLETALFRPFQSTKKNGLGIGMFQSRMVMEMHGGTIHVESEAGRGTTVRVSLPVKDPL